MTRKDFFSMVGVGTMGALMVNCLGGCKKDAAPTPPSNVNFTINLTDASAANLLNATIGYIYQNGIIIAQTTGGNYIAVSQYCTHEGVTVTFVESQQIFNCSAHGSEFTTTGGVKRGPASSSLKQYTVTKNGNVLTITG